MPGELQLDEERQTMPLLGNIDQSGSTGTGSLWNQLNYVARHLVGMVLVWVLFLTGKVLIRIFNLSESEILGELVGTWLFIGTLVGFLYLFLSLSVRISMDIISYFFRKKRGFIVRFFHKSSYIVVMLLFLIGCVIIHDHYFRMPCSGLPLLDPDHPDQPYPLPEQCSFRFVRSLMLCGMVTCLGFLLVKWIVLSISLRYQDKVYRDRIVQNRYNLYIANLLHEGCMEEALRNGLELAKAAARSGSIGSQVQPGTAERAGSAAIITGEGSDSDDEPDEGTDDENGRLDIVAPRPMAMTSHGWVKRLVTWFQRSILRRPPRRRASSAVQSSMFQSGSPSYVRLHPLLDFESFKRTVKVFKSDFTLHSLGASDITSSEAKKRSKFIFYVLSSLGTPGGGQLTKADFQKVFRLEQSASEAFELFDVNFDGFISKSELKHLFVQIYREHGNLTQSVTSSAEALKALDNLFTILSCVVLSLLYMVIFGLNVQSLLTLSLSLILGFNVIIGNFSRDVFDSLMFLFVTHPYDIGDRVRIEGDAKIYTVKQISVLRTEFYDGRGEEIYMPNPVLLRKNIINLRRSHEQWESIEMCLDLGTTHEQLSEFRSILTRHLHDTPQHFYPKFDMELCGQHANLEVYPVRFRIQCKPNYDNMRKAERHREILSFMKSTLERLGISYYPKGPDGPRVVVTVPRRFLKGTAMGSSNATSGTVHRPVAEAEPKKPKAHSSLSLDERDAKLEADQASDTSPSENERTSHDGGSIGSK